MEIFRKFDVKKIYYMKWIIKYGYKGLTCKNIGLGKKRVRLNIIVRGLYWI